MRGITKYASRFAASSPETHSNQALALFEIAVSYHGPHMPSSLQTKPQLLRSIRLWLSLFILGLILSGLTAFPLEQETAWLASFLDANPILPDSMILWIARVHAALLDTNLHYPFLAYGTDWLAFAHLVLAIAFLGPLRDPVRN